MQRLHVTGHAERVLGLVGISGGSYVLSKGIQKSLGHPF